MKKATPFSPQGGRKWIALWYLQALGLGVAAAIVAQATLLPALKTDQLIQVFGLMATITGAFIGVQGAVDFRAAKTPEVAEGNPPVDVELPDE